MLARPPSPLQAMGALGAAALMTEVQARSPSSATHPPSTGARKLRVLTHCNTGSLATSGYGTALGVIRALHEQVGVGAQAVMPAHAHAHVH